MTDTEIQRAQWAKWKAADYARHRTKRKLTRKIYMREYRARKAK